MTSGHQQDVSSSKTVLVAKTNKEDTDEMRRMCPMQKGRYVFKATNTDVRNKLPTTGTKTNPRNPNGHHRTNKIRKR